MKRLLLKLILSRQDRNFINYLLVLYANENKHCEENYTDTIRLSKLFASIKSIDND
jgi:hypothetical protein